jgi:hypothetical protein
VKDEDGDLVANSHNILNTWTNYFCQLLNVRGVNDVRQTEMHTAEPLAPERNSFDVEIAIEKLKRYKSPGIDQIPAEMIQAGGDTLRSDMHKLILFGITKNYHISGRNLLLYLFVKRVIKLTALIIEECGYYQLRTKF